MRHVPHLFNLTFLLAVNILSDSLLVVGATGAAIMLYGSYVVARASVGESSESNTKSSAMRVFVAAYALSIVVLSCLLLLSVKYEESRLAGFADPRSPYGGAEHYMDNLEERIQKRIGAPGQTGE